MTVERLAVYFIISAAAGLLPTFRILSLTGTAITPFRYGVGVSVTNPARARREVLTALTASRDGNNLPSLGIRVEALR